MRVLVPSRNVRVVSRYSLHREDIGMSIEECETTPFRETIRYNMDPPPPRPISPPPINIKEEEDRRRQFNKTGEYGIRSMLQLNFPTNSSCKSIATFTGLVVSKQIIIDSVSKVANERNSNKRKLDTSSSSSYTTSNQKLVVEKKISIQVRDEDYADVVTVYLPLYLGVQVSSCQCGIVWYSVV